jgi:two-component system sensor histidine kinase MprB
VTFGTRLTAVAAGAVAAAVAIASVVVFFVVRGSLRAEVDDALVDLAREISVRQSPAGPLLSLPRAPLGGARGYAQAVTATGQVVPPPGFEATIPAGERARAVAAGAERAFFEDMEVSAVHVRVLTVQAIPGVAVQVVRSLEEVDAVLRRLTVILLVIAAAGIGFAAVLGAGVARAALGPVRRLTEATEHVTSTSDLSRRIDASGGDELARLAGSFNGMLEALEASLAAQRDLVADASHELRTPITSLRTNIEVLQAADLPESERRLVLAEVIAQLDELTALVTDIMELARGNEPVTERDEIALHELVHAAVERARRRHGARVRFETDLAPSTVEGVPERLDRAVSNLLDNAAKWSPIGGAVRVGLRDGELEVCDEGPGIAPEDRPHVFDRFYRARSARGLPGSGLGLAIVRQVAESHGGSVAARDGPRGGARLVLRLPTRGRLRAEDEGATLG